MGRKEFKKWAKWMKRASTHQNRSAEAYARAAAASGNATGASAAAGTEEPESPMDFAAVASQIQEFLNYWGKYNIIAFFFTKIIEHIPTYFGNNGEWGIEI